MDKDKLYEEFHMKVLRFIQSKVNDYYLAEDLCSDVFVKVYENIDSFDEKKASLSTWIFTITRNRLIDYYRTRKVMEEIPENLTYEEDDEDIINEEALEKLAFALEKLDERDRKIIVRHYYNGETLKKIAEDLDISYIYVKVLHQKALNKIKNLMN